MYLIAAKLLEEQGLEHRLLLPIVKETAAKLDVCTPLSAQVDMIAQFENCKPEYQPAIPDNPVMQEIYRLMSRYIHEEKMKDAGDE
jgi:hypothetical protein